MKLLEGPFVSLIESSRRAAAIACDCLSNIGAQVFNALKAIIIFLAVIFKIGKINVSMLNIYLIFRKKSKYL